MKRRLIAGCINNWRDDGEWVNVTLDINPRPIYDEATDSFVSPDVVADLAGNLPMFRENMFDEVVCHHVLEHMPVEKAQEAIESIYRVLGRNGILDVSVPDLDAVCRAWVEGSVSKEELQKWLYGEELAQHEAGDSHRYGFWEEKLRTMLAQAGFQVGERFSGDGLELRLRARRTQGAK